jgi:hypothetical protein
MEFSGLPILRKNLEVIMKNQKLNTLKCLITCIAPIALLHCGKMPVAPVDEARNKSEISTAGAVKSTLILGKVGALQKGSTISLRKLIVTAISGAIPADTVRDTTTILGFEALTVVRTLTLKPLREWKIQAKTLDAQDSIIHLGYTTSFFVKPADTVAVSLNLTSRFSMYQASFSSLPDSVFSTQSGTGKDKLNLNRVVLKVDGMVMDDSLSANGFFTSSQNISVYFDYIVPGAHQVTLEAYGVLNNYSGILYSGSADFNVAAGHDETRTIGLDWVGPSTGKGKLTIVLGRVGKVLMVGGIHGAIM